MMAKGFFELERSGNRRSQTKLDESQLANILFCRGEKTRTFDPLHPMQVR